MKNRILLIAAIVLPTLALAQSPSFTFTPADGATGVSISNDLVIDASENIRNIDNSALNNGNIDGLITLTDNLGNPVAFDASISGDDHITINPSSNLAQETIYILTIASVEDSDGNASTGSHSVSFTTGDFTNPTVTSAQIINNLGTSFTFQITVDDDATVFYVVTASGTTPSKGEIEDGEDHNGDPAPVSGSFAVSSGVAGTAAIAGLLTNTKYRVHYFARDGGGNETTETTRNEPVRNSSSTGTVTTSGFTLTVQYDLDGNDPGVGVYYVVTTSSVKPTATQILAGQNEGGTAALASGSFSVTASSDASEAISGLDDGTTYYVHFLEVSDSGSHSEIRTEDETTADGTPPTLSSTSPADNSTTVDLSATDRLVLTFNENVNNISTAATTDSHRLIIHEGNSPSPTATYKIDRGSLVADGSDATVEALLSTATPALTLKPNTHYYVLIGNGVIEDDPGDNDYAGLSDPTVFDFTTTGVTANNVVSNICSGSFQSIGNIVISETGVADFNTGVARTLELSLENTGDFIFSTTGVSVSGASADLSALSVSVTLSKITVTYTAGSGTVLDNITISGIKIYTSGGTPSTRIIRTAGNASQDGGNGTGAVNSLTYATINVGASPPSQPALAAAQDLVHCVADDLSAKTLTLVDQGASVNYAWYSDASLSTLLTSSTNETVNLVTDLGMTSPAVQGTYKFYVVAITTCQSTPPLEVTVQVSPSPVADAGADQVAGSAVCAGAAVTLGGTPTLATPSAPGSYTYAWVDLTGTFAAAIPGVSNPPLTLANAGPITLNHQFEVTITDQNGCQDTDVKNVEVRTAIVVSRTSPATTNFSPGSPPQTLEASPPGGVFSGTGVIQTGTSPNTYKFDPGIAYNSSLPLPQNFNIFYSVTDGNGCSSGTVAVGTFTINNALFNTLAAQYCGSEFPYDADDNTLGGDVVLKVDATAYSYAMSSVDYWNNYGRFYTMGVSDWSSAVSYPAGSLVKHEDDDPLTPPFTYELYEYQGVPFNPSLPGQFPAGWTLVAGRAKVHFEGEIRNRYEAYYGGNVGNPTMRQRGITYPNPGGGPVFREYEVFTNANYVNCSGCSYVYPSMVVEFDNPADRIYRFYTYNAANYYYAGDIVRFGSQLYRCLAFNYSAAPVTPGSNASYWTNITTSNFATFYEYYDGTSSGFYSSGQYVTINRNPIVSFTGLTSPYTNPNTFCNANETYQLTANFTGGTFFVSSDGTGGAASYITGTLAEDKGLFNATPSPGRATFNPGTYFPNVPGGSVKNVYIKYEYDGGADGSGGQACLGEQVQVRSINALPQLSFDSPTPVPSAEFCYDGVNVSLKTLETTNVTFSGLGVSNSGGGNGFIDPSEAYNAKEFQDGVSYQPNEVTVTVFAARTDANNCLQTISRNFKVRGIPAASFDTNPIAGRQIYCNEDATQTIQGAQPSSFFKITYLDTPMPHFSETFGSTSGAVDDIPFNPRNIYQKGVDNGASDNITQSFRIDYTVFETSGQQCQSTISKTFSVGKRNPQNIIEVDATNDVFCSNGIPVALSGNLAPGTVNQFDISTNIAGPFVQGPGTGIANTSPGRASFTPGDIYGSVTAENDPKPIYIRYGYQSPSCTAPEYVIEEVTVYSPPDITFNTTLSQPDEHVFCQVNNESPVHTIQNTNVTLFGLGITDNGGGTGSFNPFNAYKAREAALNQTQTTQQVFDITAGITNATSGCSNTTVIQYRVQPVPVANFVPDKFVYCYEEIVAANNFNGDQVNAFYNIEYKSTPAPFSETFGSLGSPQPDITFTPKTFFDNAVAQGANALATLTFDAHYTAYDAFSCVNTITKTFQIAPVIPVEIAGIDPNEVMCSNTGSGVRRLELTPSTGRLFKSENGGPETEETTNVNAGKYDLQLPLNGRQYAFRYTVVTGNNCTNTAQKSITVLPSPVANFALSTKCEGDVISFVAANNPNPATYTWTLGTETLTGQTVTKQFPGTGAFDVKLLVEYPLTSGLVCSSTKEDDQSVVDNPVVSFNFFDVCHGDNTLFEARSEVVPISEVRWNFDDGNVTGTGSFSGNISGADTHGGLTGGKYGTPLHQFQPGIYNVEMVGRSSLGCDDTVKREVVILRNVAPSPTAIYDMNTIANGGAWEVEDLNGRTSWEFSPTTPDGTVTFNSWTTDAGGAYNSDDQSYVNSPCFNLTAFTRPVIAFNYWSDVPGGRQDGAVMQYSVDGGRVWQNVGNLNTGLDWFNSGGIAGNPGLQQVGQIGWSRENDVEWSAAKHSLDDIPASQRNKVRFRVAFGSNKDFPKIMDGFAFANVKIEERNRTILVENFTNLSSTQNNEAFKSFRSTNGVFNTNEMVKLQYHHSSVAGSDALNEVNPTDNNARAAFYGVTQNVRAFVDGGFNQTANNFSFVNNDWIGNYFSLRSLVSSPLNIGLDFPADTDGPADEFIVRATLDPISNIPAGEYNVFIAVAERNVSGQTYVLRKFLPDASGTPLTVLNETSLPQVITASYDMRHVTRNVDGTFAPIAVIVFVQDINTREVLQTYLRQDVTPESTVVTGIEERNESFNVYPNPADREMTVQLPATATQRTTLRMYDQLGKMVEESSFEIGDSQKTIATESLAGGVYLIQVETPKGVLRRKVMVTHRN